MGATCGVSSSGSADPPGVEQQLRLPVPLVWAQSLSFPRPPWHSGPSPRWAPSSLPTRMSQGGRGPRLSRPLCAGACLLQPGSERWAARSYPVAPRVGAPVQSGRALPKIQPMGRTFNPVSPSRLSRVCPWGPMPSRWQAPRGL